MRTNWHIWSGIYRAAWKPKNKAFRRNAGPIYPTVVIDVELHSWALPFAIHAGGPLLGKPGFHFRVGPVNVGWSRL